MDLYTTFIELAFDFPFDPILVSAVRAVFGRKAQTMLFERRASCETLIFVIMWAFSICITGVKIKNRIRFLKT